MFFYTVFQSQMEKVEQLMSKIADPSRPYDHKYQARTILENLLKAPELDDSPPAVAAKGIIEYILGGNFFQTQQITQSGKHYKASFQYFLSLPLQEQSRHINTIQDLLNSLGILSCNRGQNAQGLQYFKKSQQIYDFLQSVNQQQYSHFFPDFLKGVRNFKFIIDGGINQTKSQQNFTMCMFYMAQAYSKLGENVKAAFYCAETMKRQIESGDFDVKDWAINCINLAEYYTENEYFNQALYVLNCGLSIIPSMTRKKLTATMHMQIGRVYRAFLQYGLELNREEKPASETTFEAVITFQSLKVPFPAVKPPVELETAKQVFKHANLHFKMALEFFVIDGYVTEHIEMKRDISALYKVLCYFQNSNPRILAMCQRRLELLEEYTRDLNKQAYSNLWQHLMNEVATIYIDIFDIKSQTRKRQKPEIQAKTNQFALTSIEKQTQLLDFIKKFDLNEDTAKDVIQSSLNLMFGIAKTFSKLENVEPYQRVEYMKNSLYWYQTIHSYLKEVEKGKYPDAVPDLQEQLRISEEMVGLLPIRISQVNAEAQQFNKCVQLEKSRVQLGILCRNQMSFEAEKFKRRQACELVKDYIKEVDENMKLKKELIKEVSLKFILVQG